MEPHQHRVVNEREDLVDKVTKLRAFLGTDRYNGLDSDERGRLDRQLGAMTIYLDILDERITAFAK